MLAKTAPRAFSERFFLWEIVVFLLRFPSVIGGEHPVVLLKSGIEIAQGGVARQLRDLGDRALGIDKKGRGDIHAALGEQTVEGIVIIFVDETV